VGESFARTLCRIPKPSSVSAGDACARCDLITDGISTVETTEITSERLARNEGLLGCRVLEFFNSSLEGVDLCLKVYERWSRL